MGNLGGNGFFKVFMGLGRLVFELGVLFIFFDSTYFRKLKELRKYEVFD